MPWRRAAMMLANNKRTRRKSQRRRLVTLLCEKINTLPEGLSYVLIEGLK